MLMSVSLLDQLQHALNTQLKSTTTKKGKRSTRMRKKDQLVKRREEEKGTVHLVYWE